MRHSPAGWSLIASWSATVIVYRTPTEDILKVREKTFLYLEERAKAQTLPIPIWTSFQDPAGNHLDQLQSRVAEKTPTGLGG